MALPLLPTLLTLLLLAIPLLSLRLLSILPPFRARAPRVRRSPARKVHIMILLGSGGHTAEMLSILRNATTRESLRWEGFHTRTWVVSSGDGFSEAFARKFEAEVGGLEGAFGDGTSKDEGTGTGEAPGYRIVTVPRARRIHQSLLSTPFSCIQCFIACVRLLCSTSYPDIILCNGPATAAICVFASVALRFVGWRGANNPSKMRTVYVESWARVRKLSLSGRLLAWVVDRLVVQWPELEGVAGRGEFRGVLV